MKTPGIARRDAAPARPARSGRTVLRVHVGRLAIDGLSRGDERRITSAMGKRLAALVDARPGLDWSAVSNVDRVDGGTVPAGATPAELGRHLATQIFRGLTR